jgi:uncharacterized protein (TIGR00255 family)
MPRSMTGFGRSELKTDQFEIATEIRSLNNRFLDISLKLPKSFISYEYDIKALIKNKIERGKINITVNFKDLSLTNGNFMVKRERIEYYLKILNGIKKLADIQEQVTLNHLLSFKELVEPEESLIENEQVVAALIKNIKQTLDQLNEMRSQEGAHIAGDLRNHLNQIGKSVETIYQQGQTVPREELDKLKERVKGLIDPRAVEVSRLEQELALLADRVDVTEECLRLKSHIKLFTEELVRQGAIGKKLTFILQEMHREANTIGAKTTNITIAHEVINIKEEVEKIREQVQNLE